MSPVIYLVIRLPFFRANVARPLLYCLPCLVERVSGAAGTFSGETNNMLRRVGRLVRVRVEREQLQ
jgi:hypothetical protein